MSLTPKQKAFASLPARGVWIEIISISAPSLSNSSLPARGVWIEIWMIKDGKQVEYGHSPRGECGLKLSIAVQMNRKA